MPSEGFPLGVLLRYGSSFLIHPGRSVRNSAALFPHDIDMTMPSSVILRTTSCMVSGSAFSFFDRNSSVTPLFLTMVLMMLQLTPS